MNALLFEILTSNWLLHSTNPDMYGAMVVSMLRGDSIQGEDFSAARKLSRSFVLSGSREPTDPSQLLNSPDLSQGSIAVIPIRGIIMKEDAQCGPRGSVSIANDIRSAQSNPNIKSILLMIDSPGGTTSYTDILSEVVSKCSKKVVAYIEGTGASAAYWIASGASTIVCSSELDVVGSIGTMLSYMDMKPYFESQGVVVHDVYATLSTEKNQALTDLRAGNYDAVRSELLDKINSKFHATVCANRPNLDPAALTGRTYFATDAINAGLIDSIGSFQYALELADTLPDTYSTQPKTITNMKSIKMLAVWTAIASFFNFTENIESNDLTQEMVGQLNGVLDELTTNHDKAVNQVGTLTTALSEKVVELDAAKAAIATLQSALTATQTAFDVFKASDARDEIRSGKSADKTDEVIASDRYLHNIIADQNS